MIIQFTSEPYNNSLNRSRDSSIFIRKIECCLAILPARLMRALGARLTACSKFLSGVASMAQGPGR
jgi:hypothetical protein